MGILGWLTGNGSNRRNNTKIARVKKELQFMTSEQKINRLRKMKKNGYYPSAAAKGIDDIYVYDEDLTTDFLIYYFLFMDEYIRTEAEMELPMDSESDMEVSSEEVLMTSEVVSEEISIEESVTNENKKLEVSESTSYEESDLKSCSSDSYDDSDNCDCGD